MLNRFVFCHRLAFFSVFFAGIFCGSVPPGPVLLNNSQAATLLFSSDINRSGSGFVIRHRAVRGLSDPGGSHDKQHRHTVQHAAAHISACYKQHICSAALQADIRSALCPSLKLYTHTVYTVHTQSNYLLCGMIVDLVATWELCGQMSHDTIMSSTRHTHTHTHTHTHSE